MTRRRLLRLLTLAGLTVVVGHRGGVIRRIGRMLDRSTSTVALVACEGYEKNLAARVELAWNLGGGPSVTGRRVLLKPNLVDHSPTRPINVDSRFVGCVVDLMKRRGAAEVVIGEGPGNRRDVKTLLGETGLGDELARRKAAFVDLNTADLVRRSLVDLPLGKPSRLGTLWLPRAVTEADVVVSLAKMKTHHWTGVTLSLKNLFGVIPGSRYGWPKNLLHWNGIDRSVLEIAATVRPAFAMVDGIVGMEGDGPLDGTAREAGVLLAGRDLVALDATAARVMVVRPDKILYLAAGQELGMGWADSDRIHVVGDPVASHRKVFSLPKGFEDMGDST